MNFTLNVSIQIIWVRRRKDVFGSDVVALTVRVLRDVIPCHLGARIKAGKRERVLPLLVCLFSSSIVASVFNFLYYSVHMKMQKNA